MSVPLVRDRVAEPDETFFLNLTEPAGATIDDGRGKAVIRDDD